MEAALRQRLALAGVDTDAVSVITKVVRRADVPPALAAAWAARWDGQELTDFAALSQADRQRLLAREVDAFLQSPVNLAARVAHGVAQSADPDLRLAAELALDLSDILVAFERDVLVPSVSPFTGKVKYLNDTELDVVTSVAIVEVSSKHSAKGKLSQLAAQLLPRANLAGLPVLHFLPNLDPASVAAFLIGGSAGVYNDRAAIVAAVRALP